MNKLANPSFNFAHIFSVYVKGKLTFRLDERLKESMKIFSPKSSGPALGSFDPECLGYSRENRTKWKTA